MSENENVYRELQEHLDQLPIGFPATKSGAELRILKHIFTPAEAKIATKLRFEYEPIEVIYDRMDKSKISIEQLKQILDNIAKKGGVHYIIKDEEKHYANPLLLLGMYEYQVHKLTKEFLEDVVQYNTEAFAMELFSTGVTQFRILPVEESITSEHFMTTYEDLKEIIKSIEEPICLTECICRQATDLLGEPCKRTSLREICMGFGAMANFYIDQGWGRAISRDEALEVLRKSASDGLVFETGNAQRPNFICSCCSCCCGLLRWISELPSPRDFVVSNYFAVVDSELCSGCETCLDRCQTGAVKMVEGISTINQKRCIGCGNCVSTCPSEAIQLQKVEKEKIPPKTDDDLYDEIKEKKEKILRARKRAEERKKRREAKKKAQ